MGSEGGLTLVHRLRGQPSARRKRAELRARVLALYAEERYADFGPTPMAEQLEKLKLKVNHETLRRWRLASGEQPVRRKVMVRTLRDGRVQLVYRGKPLRWRRLPEGMVRKPSSVRKERVAGKVKATRLANPSAQAERD